MSYTTIKDAYNDSHISKMIINKPIISKEVKNPKPIISKEVKNPKPIISKKEKYSWIHEYFDDVIIITLPKRKEKMKSIMNSLKIAPIYFDAILKDNLNKNELIKSNIITNDSDLNIGRIACHLSHITVLKKFLEATSETCFIFEDDLYKPDNLSELKTQFNQINFYIKNNKLLNDWDIINFGRCWDNCDNQQIIIKKQGNIPAIVKSDFSKCRHAYAVSRKGAENIIKNTLPLSNIPGDRLIALHNQKNNINMFSLSPPIFFQNRKDFGTNLGNFAPKSNECAYKSSYKKYYNDNVNKKFLNDNK